MFIRKTDAERLFKKAYKGVGLRLASDENGLILTGRKWYMYIDREHLPKEVLGAVISLTGVIPPIGEQYLCNPGGDQTELYQAEPGQDPCREGLQAQADGEQIHMTDLVIADFVSEPLRIYTTSKGRAYLVPDVYRKICDTGNLEENEEMQGCFVTEAGWIWWVSDYMTFGISPYAPDNGMELLRKITEAGIL